MHFSQTFSLSFILTKETTTRWQQNVKEFDVLPLYFSFENV